MNPLTSITGAIVTGVILALLIAFGIEMGAGAIHFNELGLARWVHILSGIMWIGLLYYFNVVQVPGLAAAAADKGGPGGAGVTKYIAPRALLWFRWAAVATWLTGFWYLASAHQFMNALTLGQGTNNLTACQELLKAWRAMGGAQDYLVAQCHTITRKLFQEAGYGCVNEAKAVAVAREVRARCRQVLRNPDGYEIWADY